MFTTFVSQLGHMVGLDASFLNRYDVIIAVFARHDINSWSTANVFRRWLVIASVQLHGTDLLHSGSCLNLTGFLEICAWFHLVPKTFVAKKSLYTI